MKKRYLYSLLFGIPGFFVSAIISLIVFGAVIGMLWIYVFGDNPWPFSTETMLSILLVLAFLMVWISLIAMGYVVGKKFEKDPILNWKHILVSGGSHSSLSFASFSSSGPWEISDQNQRVCYVVIFVVKRDIREVECPQETLAIEVVVVSTILGTKL